MSEPTYDVEAAPVVKVAQDLTAIMDMAARLETQAINRGSSRLMPGGDAMVSLAYPASPEAWEYRFETSERLALDTSHVDEEDDSWEPPLQTLLFWSEQWRYEHDAYYYLRPTVTTEANFLKSVLGWAWDHEPHWDDFATDVATARRRLENTLMEGARSERGVPCMYPECRGKRLIRKLVPHRREDGSKGWKLSDWHCPNCKRSWDEDRYAAQVTAAHERTKFEEIDGETWCTPQWAAKRVGRPERTIKTWMQRREIDTVCIVAGRRKGFVRLSQVQERHDGAQVRARPQLTM